MYVFDGDDATVLVDFKVDGDFVSPASASYTVRGHDGVAIAGLINQPITLIGAPTSSAVTVAAVNNTLSGATVLNRTVIVKFVYGGNTYQVLKPYTVIRFLLHTVDVARVRNVLGLFEHELGEQDVDLFRAYLGVEDKVTAAILDAAMVATDFTNVRANDAIAYLAALETIPSLRLRAMHKTSDDNIEVSRLAKVDFSALEQDIANRYSEALQDLNPSSDVVTPTLMVVTNPTDTITGV